MAPPLAVCLPLPAPLSLGGSGEGAAGTPAAAGSALPSASLASRLRLHAAIAGISAALTELNSTVESMSGGTGGEKGAGGERERGGGGEGGRVDLVGPKRTKKNALCGKRGKRRIAGPAGARLPGRSLPPPHQADIAADLVPIARVYNERARPDRPFLARGRDYYKKERRDARGRKTSQKPRAFFLYLSHPPPSFSLSSPRLLRRLQAPPLRARLWLTHPPRPQTAPPQ